jgi:hypothetical protein
VPPEVPEQGGGPYRERAQSDEAPTPRSDWGESVVLALFVAPWLVPLSRALRGAETFGWSAAIGLVASLAMLASMGRGVVARVRRHVR